MKRGGRRRKINSAARRTRGPAWSNAQRRRANGIQRAAPEFEKREGLQTTDHLKTPGCPACANGLKSSGSEFGRRLASGKGRRLLLFCKTFSLSPCVEEKTPPVAEKPSERDSKQPATAVLSDALRVSPTILLFSAGQRPRARPVGRDNLISPRASSGRRAHMGPFRRKAEAPPRIPDASGLGSR